MGHVDEWLRRLGYLETSSILGRGASPGHRPYAAEIADMLSSDRGIGASHVYCIDDVPVVCFVDGEAIDQPFAHWIDTVRRKVWNQGLASVVVVLRAKSLAAYSVLRRKERPQTLALREASSRGPWSAHDFETCFVQQRLPKWFEPDKRVDRRLLRNLIDTVRDLASCGLDRTAAEALMAQVIFVRYLEQRGIVGGRYREKHGLQQLPELVNTRSGRDIDELLKRLGSTFNGDFLNGHGTGAPPWASLTESVFRLVERFLKGEEMKSGQTSLWGYDFSIIPVELISGIYESFLGERQRTRGAYYTPRHLATLAVEQAFEGDPRPHERTVFDGACGSGILITTAFQKILASAEQEAGIPLTFTERVELMRKRIFGSDIDPTACWITAFSLYLCLLDRLTPSDIELLQEDEGTKLPHLTISTQPGGTEAGGRGNIAAGEEVGDIFNARNPLAGTRRYDIVLSNPPWREGGKGRETFEEWMGINLPDANVPDRQIAAAFAYRVAQCARMGGRIVLIMPLNLMIGTESLTFRQDLLGQMRIERIINFADLRHLLFPNAKNACALLISTPRKQEDGDLFEPDERIEYWTPKADLSIAFGRLAVTSDDRSLVHPQEVFAKASALIHRYWGGPRDVALLERLKRYGTIGSTMETRPEPWVANKGFHATDRNNKNYDLNEPGWRWLREMAFLSTPRVPITHPIVAADTQFGRVGASFKTVATPGGDEGKLYRNNRVIWRNGLGPDLRVRALFTDVSFAFQHTTCAIGGVTGDRALLKLLTAYLRSPLATYLLIMNSYSVIADRSAVSKAEIMTLPFITPERHSDKILASKTLKYIDDAFDRLAAVPEYMRDHAYADAAFDMDESIMDYFGLSDREKTLVRETAEYVAPSLQPTSYRSIETPLQAPPSEPDVDRYTALLAGALAHWRKRRGGEGAVEIEAAIGQHTSMFGAVRLRAMNSGHDEVTASQSDEAVDRLLRSLHQDTSKERMASDMEAGMALVPDLMLACGNVLYLVKPMQRRFWMARSALADAERIAVGIDAVRPMAGPSHAGLSW